jgi:hypothetical protein
VPDKFFCAVVQPGSKEVRMGLGLAGRAALVMGVEVEHRVADITRAEDVRGLISHVANRFGGARGTCSVGYGQV